MDFAMDLKSTLDKIGHDFAAALGAEPIDLDGATNVEEVLTEDGPAVVWKLLSLSESPRAPLYLLDFLLGAKTTNDVGSYQLMSLLEGLSISQGDTITVRDYSGASASDPTGEFFITAVEMNPQAFDALAGIRLFGIQARAVRFL